MKILRQERSKNSPENILPDSPSCAFHLIREAVAAGTAKPSDQALPLPQKVSVLRFYGDEAPTLHDDPLAMPDKELIAEPVLARDQAPRLVLVNAGAGELLVNGTRAPRFSLLREKDQFVFDDSCVFHVTIFHRPQIGPAPADKVGKPCPICLTPFTSDEKAVCYRCACGTLLHLNDPSTGLECARAVSACPHCKQGVTLAPGYSWLPDFCHE